MSDSPSTQDSPQTEADLVKACVTDYVASMTNGFLEDGSRFYKALGQFSLHAKGGKTQLIVVLDSPAEHWCWAAAKAALKC